RKRRLRRRRRTGKPAATGWSRSSRPPCAPPRQCPKARSRPL
ncbi:MAG: hypothetical protein AVDCRST_MAG28-3946, partial [uncultured Rubrobacteraceae bacterium]